MFIIILLISILFLILFDLVTIDIAALIMLAALVITNTITVEEAASGFGNPAVLTIVFMFIISEALTASGIIHHISTTLYRVSKKSFIVSIIILLLAVGLLSGFVSNTAIVTISIPLLIKISYIFKISPSRILLPFSWIAIVGGTTTLIGTSTNLIIYSLAKTHGIEGISMFTLFPLGIILIITTIAYILLFPIKFIPPRTQPYEPLTNKYGIASNFITELKVPSYSSLIGKTVISEKIRSDFGVTVISIIRNKERIAVDLRSTPIREEDILVVIGPPESIILFRDYYRLLLLTDIKLRDTELSNGTSILAELQLSPTSELIGKTIKEINFRKRFGVFVLALKHTGKLISNKLANVPLAMGDTLLVYGPRRQVEALVTTPDFISLHEIPLVIHLGSKWWIAPFTLLAIIAAISIKIVTIFEAFLIGVLILITTKRLTPARAYHSVNWQVIFMIAAFLPLGIAVEKTELDKQIANFVTTTFHTNDPLSLLATTFLITTLLTEIVSNNSAAIIMFPISIKFAELSGASPLPFIIAVAFAASLSFLTPIGYQTNAMVQAPGGYKPSDYLIFGLPLKIITTLVSIYTIPKIWPF